MIHRHCVKSFLVRSLSGPYFSVFGMNTEIYGINLCIQSKYGEVRTRKNSVFGHFSLSGSPKKSKVRLVGSVIAYSATRYLEDNR